MEAGGAGYRHWGVTVRTVDQQLEGLEKLILAALDELCALESPGPSQDRALGELERVITALEKQCDLSHAARRRTRDAREMFERIAEVAALRRTVHADRVPPVARRTH